jgi:DNA-binding transcriptional regulator YiaG
MKTQTKGFMYPTRDEAMKYISLLDSNGVTIGDYMNELGVSFMAVYRWKNAKSSPSPAHVKLLSQMCDKRSLKWLK